MMLARYAVEKEKDTNNKIWKERRPAEEHSGAKLGGPAVVYLVVKYGD